MRTLRIRNHVDLLATISTLLGFRPENSLVMVTIGGPNFHARIDYHPEGVRDTCTALVAPCLQYDVKAVLLVLFAGEPTNVDYMTEVKAHFEEEGIAVMDFLHSTGERYRTLTDDTWHQYSTHSNPLAGPSLTREQVAKSVEWLGDPLPAGRDLGVAVVNLVGADTITDADLADLVTTMGSNAGTRDALLSAMADHPEESSVWFADLLPRVPVDFGTVAFTEFCAWGAYLAGNGAKAWIILDRTQERGSLGDLLTVALNQAINPREARKILGA